MCINTHEFNHLTIMVTFAIVVVVKTATVRSGFVRVQAPNALDIMGILRVHYKAPLIGAVVRRLSCFFRKVVFFLFLCFPFFFPSMNLQIVKYSYTCRHTYVKCVSCKKDTLSSNIYFATYLASCKYYLYMFVCIYMYVCVSV